ncbi:MAG: hypothetical protein AAFQ85_10055 [Pseudomonadota bacterium]
MAYRVAIQLFFFLLPFMAFGLYRLLVADAEADGRKAWPVHWLFGIGAAISAAVWFWFVFSEDRDRNVCREPAQFENGVLIPGRDVPCEKDISRVGLPQEGERPGPAQGVGGDSPDTSDQIRARARTPSDVDADADNGDGE